jgi:hypothetical protein
VGLRLESRMLASMIKNPAPFLISAALRPSASAEPSAFAKPMADRMADRPPSASPQTASLPHRPPPSALRPPSSAFRPPSHRLTANRLTVLRPLGSVDWTSARPRFVSCEIRLGRFCTGVEPRTIRVPGRGASLVLLKRFPCPTFPFPPV